MGRGMKLIALDFDGVCVKNAFPNIGEDIDGAVETLRDLYGADYRLALWTVRENGSHSPYLGSRNFLDEAVNWFIDRDIPLESVNTTPTWKETRILYGGRKIFADITIDDTDVQGFCGWDKVREILL